MSASLAESFEGELSVEVPQVYELLRIAVSISELAGSKQNIQFVSRDTAYYDNVIAHFSPYRDHPFIKTLETQLTDKVQEQELAVLMALDLESLNFTMSADGKLEENDNYAVPSMDEPIGRLIGWPTFKRYQNQLEDFTKQTDFANFYAKHKFYYDEISSNANELCDFQDMWDWVESQFPNHHDSYRIIYSPLRGAFHSTQTVRSEDGSSQTLMFVSPPTLHKSAASYSSTERGSICRVVFTEIDHNYVNPLSDEFKDELVRVMPDWTAWEEGDFYGSSYRTFNEYMTWALFSLYVLDTYEVSEAEAIIEFKVEQMENERGFPRYAEFNEELIRLYQERDEDSTVADLYPEILAFVDSFN